MKCEKCEGIYHMTETHECPKPEEAEAGAKAEIEAGAENKEE